MAWRIWANAWQADPIYRHLSSGEVGVFGATIMHSLSLSLSLCTCMQGDFPNGFYHSTNAAVKHLVQLWRIKMRQTNRKYVCSGLSEWLWNVCRLFREVLVYFMFPFLCITFLLLQFETTNAHSFIKATVLQHTSSFHRGTKLYKTATSSAMHVTELS